MAEPELVSAEKVIAAFVKGIVLGVLVVAPFLALGAFILGTYYGRH